MVHALPDGISRIGIGNFGHQKGRRSKQLCSQPKPAECAHGHGALNPDRCRWGHQISWKSMTSVRVAKSYICGVGSGTRQREKATEYMSCRNVFGRKFFTNQVSSGVLRQGQEITAERGHLRTNYWQMSSEKVPWRSLRSESLITKERGIGAISRK